MALKKASAFTDANGYFYFLSMDGQNFVGFGKNEKMVLLDLQIKKQNAEKLYTLLFDFISYFVLKVSKITSRIILK